MNEIELIEQLIKCEHENIDDINEDFIISNELKDRDIADCHKRISLLENIKIKVCGMDKLYNEPIDTISLDGFKMIHIVDARTRNILLARADDAKAVIDEICKVCNIKEKGRLLYCLYPNGKSAVAEDIKEYFNNSGDKVKLKKEIEQLKQENELLKRIVREN